MGLDLRSLQYDGGFSHSDIMRARREDADRLHEKWRARRAPRHDFDRTAPFAGLVELIDSIPHADPKRRWVTQPEENTRPCTPD